jgi:hypothetical protein
LRWSHRGNGDAGRSYRVGWLTRLDAALGRRLVPRCGYEDDQHVAIDRRSRAATISCSPNNSGEPLRKSKLLERVLQPAAERAGLGRAMWHQFRHIDSSLLNDLHVPVKIAQEQLGTPASRRR